MGTYYSIIYISPRPSVNEQVSVGLFLGNQNNILFDFSIYKLEFANKLIPKETILFVKNYLLGIKNSLEKKERNKIEFDYEEKIIVFNATYLNYLSQYSNNLIQFSAPKSIDLLCSEDNFNLLFKDMIFHDIASRQKHFLEDYSKLKTLYYPKIKDRVNLYPKVETIKIENSIIPKSFLPRQVDFIGKNGEFVAGQYFDFSKHKFNLEDSISRFLLFLKELGPNTHSFLLGTEPLKISYPAQHKIWESIRKMGERSSFIPESEFSLVEEYLEHKGVVPIF